MLEELIKELLKSLDFLDNIQLELEEKQEEYNSTKLTLESEIRTKRQSIGIHHSHSMYHDYNVIRRNRSPSTNFTEEEEENIKREISLLEQKLSKLKRMINLATERIANIRSLRTNLVESTSNIRIDKLKFEQLISLEQEESLKALQKSQEYHELKLQELKEQHQQEIATLKAQIEQNHG
jgi:hypothetical protein